jgi:CRISPR-associated protein Cmr5
MKQTLEQERAQDAWNCAESAKRELAQKYGDYVNVARGLPALIMNSGLMQVLAFTHEKSKKAREKLEQGKRNDIQKNDGLQYALLEKHLLAWLQQRKHSELDDFASFMQTLMKKEARQFQAVTTEALAWLKWLRQIAPALQD